jgi:hypothetical protein
MIPTLVALAVAASGHAMGCAPQTLPPAIDSAGELTHISHSIEFAATPSLAPPGRAWVVRLVQGQLPSLEIIRLRRRNDCNQYVLDRKWQAPLDDAAYEDALQKIAPFGIPSSSAIVPAHRKIFESLVLDGTAISLRLHNSVWTISRNINLGDRDGAAISAIFRDLVEQHVPAGELPDLGWRSR